MPGKVHPTDRIIKVVQIQTGAGKVKELCEDQNLEEKHYGQIAFNSFLDCFLKCHTSTLLIQQVYRCSP